MSSGWFVLTVVASIVLCSGCVLAVAVMRAAWAHSQREALTSADLRALEESALLLIEQMRSEADRGIAEMETRSASLRELICEADSKLRSLRDATAALPAHVAGDPGPSETRHACADRGRVLELASSGMDCSEIARETGLGCGEVKLMLDLARVPAV